MIRLELSRYKNSIHPVGAVFVSFGILAGQIPDFPFFREHMECSPTIIAGAVRLVEPHAVLFTFGGFYGTITWIRDLIAKLEFVAWNRR